MYVYGLKNDWKLRYEELYCDKNYYTAVTNKEEGWFDIETLPCDVHVPLIENGIIEDPVIAGNCFKCEWIEDKSWWFRKIFNAGEDLINSQNSELVIEGLDVKADLFLNGTYLGHHGSAMYPFRKDVRDILHEGENILVIRVTSGLEYYSELELSKIKDYIACEYKGGRGPRGDNRRVFVRKPQYVYGWDWNPRIATCGIMGDARIEAYKEIAVRNVRFTTNKLSGNDAEIAVEAEIENLYPISTLDVNVRLDICFNDAPVQSVEKEAFMTSGLNYVEFDVTINNPRLWWPNGMGGQNLYTVKICATAPDNNSDYREIKAGIRTVKLNTDKISNTSRMFAFEINGIRTFCKGGNWETPDSIYSRISDDKYELLVREAKEANFNMFRFNGVNAYERDFFYECCDRYGILIWQDFAGFSCAAYPDEMDWFRHEVEKEADYQTKRLRNHPCIALWCGSNECQCLLLTYRKNSYWAGDKKPASPAGTVIYNKIIPWTVRKNCPDVPYWNSSPYGGATDLESNDYGDRHHWIFLDADSGMNERITLEEYDKIACKFVSEFGCIGPTKKSSLYKYYGSENVDMESSIWKMHTNTFEKDIIKAAISKHYTDAKVLSLDEYLLYAGLFQGVMLGYALESMRYAENNYGALIWSFNDAWGEVGWSIIDYYTTRKISYYFVKRALAHKKLILREDEGKINIICMNDTRDMLEFELEYGYMTFDGMKEDTVREKVTVGPFTKAVVAARIKKGPYDTLKGLYYARADENSGIAPATLRTGDFKNLFIPQPVISLTGLNECKGKVAFTVTSDKYAHGVHFGLNDDALLSDEYFDLLPGESRKITVLNDNIEIAIDDINPGYVYVKL
ncbi:MAG: beta-mannosidase [Ruminiclostridium sp.]|nr:beta-mannosidase [Ruminiclostridium sp.]